MDLCKKEAFGQGFVLGAAYFPHEGSKYSEDGVFDDLLLDLTELNGRYEMPVVLLGDFNATTGLVDDSIPSESSHVPDFSFQDSGVLESLHTLSLLGIDLKRYSQDRTANRHGYKLLHCLRTADLKIVDGRFGNDAGVGNFTCVNANGQSVIDYMIMSTCLLPNITLFDVDVLDKCLSDVHCPLVMHITVNPRPTGGAISSPPLVFLRYLLNRCRYHRQSCSTLSPNIFTHCVKILKSRVT